MKISWISVLGILSAVFFIYVFINSNDTFGDKPVAGFLFGISLIYIILGFREKFKNLFIKTSLILVAVAGVADFLFFLLVQPTGTNDTPQLINNIRLPIVLIGSITGLCLLILGSVIWIYNEAKDFRARKSG